METTDMKVLSGLESYGSLGHFKGQILIQSDKFDSLPEEVRSSISYDRELEEIRGKIDMEWAKINEHADRVNHSDKLAGLFKQAGFDPIYIEVIDSKYCSEACCYKFPWIIATTSRGRIKLGWRKRVMNLDWSDSDITAMGEILFKDEDVTKGEKYIHCWGEDKAVEYLKRLNEAGKKNG